MITGPTVGLPLMYRGDQRLSREARDRRKGPSVPDIENLDQVTQDLQEIAAALQRVFDALSIEWPPRTT